jgi:hypothetical protein
MKPIPGQSPRLTSEAAGPLDGPPVPRVLGELGPDGTGPTLLVVSGLHGNEPAGVVASCSVVDALSSRAAALRGRIHFITGNRSALAAGVRYLDRDLNRAWTPARLRLLREGSPPGFELDVAREDREQRELLAELERVLDLSGPAYALDLHTTSGPDGVFTTIGDTLENRSLARAFPVPLVLGLEELVEGTLHEYLGDRGVVSLAFEAGQHIEPEAVARAEAAIWILIGATGLLPEADLPELHEARRLLARTGRRFPRVLEFRHRHALSDGDGFRMRDGYRSFLPIVPGEAIGDDHGGPVRSPERGRLLMPLYQPQGHDGFFVVREFRVFWLHVSQLLRGLGVGRVVHWLPGIRRHPAITGGLVVNRRIARWYPLQILHLLGFRRHIEDGDQLVVLQRGVEVPGSSEEPNPEESARPARAQEDAGDGPLPPD